MGRLGAAQNIVSGNAVLNVVGGTVAPSCMASGSADPSTRFRGTFVVNQAHETGEMDDEFHSLKEAKDSPDWPKWESSI